MQIRRRILFAFCATVFGLAACDASPMAPSEPSIEDHRFTPSMNPLPISDECVIRNGVFLCPPTGTSTKTDSTTTSSTETSSDECVIRNGVFLCPPSAENLQ